MFKRRDKLSSNANGESVMERTSTQKKSYYDEAIDWEVSRSILLESSERRAWYICVFLLIMLVCSWVGLFFLLPLKKDVPYVVQVDNVSGRTEVSEVYNPKKLNYDAVMDKYWLSNFVTHFERYNYYILRDDFRTVQLMSEKPVWNEFQNLYRGDNALHKLYRDKMRVDVEIISTMLQKFERGDKSRGATVRFRINQVDLTSNDNKILQSRVFTVDIKYDYEILSLNERDRLINPLGFRVKSYNAVADN